MLAPLQVEKDKRGRRACQRLGDTLSISLPSLLFFYYSCLLFFFCCCYLFVNGYLILIIVVVIMYKGGISGRGEVGEVMPARW